jgi:hypothetical protein
MNAPNRTKYSMIERPSRKRSREDTIYPLKMLSVSLTG